MRTIAAAAGVCPMTVSLALRAHSSIPPATRTRIQRIARQQGYAPDPVVARLMHHLGTRRVKRFRANLCALTPAIPTPRPGSYIEVMLSSMRARAESLGYAFSVVDIDDHAGGPDPLRRMLRARGVEGILLTPMNEPRDLTPLLDWGEFSVVSATPSVTRPLFHAVSPNHYDNMMRICAGLAALGYRRVGLAMPRDRDERVHHRWTGAVAWHQLFGANSRIPPLIDDTSPVRMDPGRLDRWLRRWQPDVVVTDLVEADVAGALGRVFAESRRPPLVGMNWHKAEAEAGIDQRVESIGAIAVELVARMIQHGEKGIPPTPHTTSVDGVWKPGSLRRQSGRLRLAAT